MQIKEFKLLFRDVMFYMNGRADVAPSAWDKDSWLYPLDWSYQLERESDYFSPKDRAGIPLRDFRGTLGCQYLISRIAGYALALWNRWRTTKNVSDRCAFLQIADWFLLSDDGRYPHNFPVAGMKVPWISCISQGEAASVLCRAFVETGLIQYLRQAIAAISPMQISIEKGGLQSKLADGRMFLEEYPGTEYQHVLNGCLYAAVGINDVMRLTRCSNPEFRFLFGNLIDAIGSNISLWDVDGWSTYDYLSASGTTPNLNTMTYQVLQSALLAYLAAASDDARLLQMGTRWLQSARTPNKRLNALYRKVLYRFTAGW